MTWTNDGAFTSAFSAPVQHSDVRMAAKTKRKTPEA